MSWYMLGDKPIFFENDKLIDKKLKKKLTAIQAPDAIGGAWKTKQGKRRISPQKLVKLEEE